ncbi:TPA: S49 family peptidase [Providencia alcalifaciens]
MQRNLFHRLSQAIHAPLLLEPAYARVFFCALGKEMGIERLHIPTHEELLDKSMMSAVTDSYLSGEKPSARFYQVTNGIAILPVSGTLVHKLGGMRPFSGMTGYDGITARLQQAIADPDVKGILLDIDSPGGEANGAFDCADMIYRLRDKKPIWALANEQACSAAMLIAAACHKRLVTQTAHIGSIGVIMAHTNYAQQLEKQGIEITLVYSGAHKADLSRTKPLSEDVLSQCQREMDSVRTLFAEKVAMYTGLSIDAVLATEAATYRGQAGIDIGLADEMVNASDAVLVMTAALNAKAIGGKMPQSNEHQTATQERERVMGILTCEEAKGREMLAQMLAGQPSMTVAQAQAILLASTPVLSPALQAEVQIENTQTESNVHRILALDEAQGRETLAQALAATPNMTVEQAKTLLSASPQEAALRERILALDEAKECQALAEKLADIPNMTVEQARGVLAVAREGGHLSGATHFEQFMAAHNPPPVGANARTENQNEADSEYSLMMTIPGTPTQIA